MESNFVLISGERRFGISQINLENRSLIRNFDHCMMRKLTFLYMLALGILAYAQPRFVADTEIKKMGEVLFQKPQTVVFAFTNKGNKPLHIKKVEPSCGCTKATYTRGNIAPGARGEITVEYDAGMLGTFSKYVEVYTNAGKDPEFLVFQGRVVRELADYAIGFPIDLGNVRMSTNYVEFDNVKKGERLATTLQVVNTERSAYRPELMHLPPYLHAEYVPKVIPGGQTGTIRLILDSDQLATYGLNQTSVYLARYSGDKIRLSESEVSFSKDAKKMKAVVVVNNDGTAPLLVHGLQVFNHAVEVALSNRTIQPGKSVKLKITVKKHLLDRFKARPRVLIISDDAKTPVKTLDITIK